MKVSKLVLSLFCIWCVIRLAHAGCPFAASLTTGRQLAARADSRQAMLIAQNTAIDVGMPSYIFFWDSPSVPNDILDLYNRSKTLIFAEQSFAHSCDDHLVKNSILSAIADAVPLEARCRARPKCPPAGYHYPKPSGICNNPNDPIRGAAHAPFGRILPANYADGIHAVRQSVTNQPLPSPRLIGNVALQHSVYGTLPDRRANHLSLLFGQYIAHDMSSRHVENNPAGGNGLRCCSSDYAERLRDEMSFNGCLPAAVPADDPFLAQFGIGCIDYIRTRVVFNNNCTVGPAEKTNAVTHFMDQSNIYGSTDSALIAVRTLTAGRLSVGPSGVMAENPGDFTGNFRFFTGDYRGAFFLTLSLLHSLFIRLHNVIATGLAESHANWTDDQLFLESRRLVTAFYQHFAYDEWLPLYVGAKVVAERKLSCGGTGSGQCGRYDATVDASTTNEFSTAAFRLFHVNTPYAVNIYNPDYSVNVSMALNATVIGAGMLTTQYEGVLRGLLKDPIRLNGFPNHIRNNLFNNYNADGVGMDLASIDILRGRDHGLGTYVDYFTTFTGRSVTNWNDLKVVFSKKSIDVLQQVYSSVLDVDLYVGLLLEKKHKEYVGLVGRQIIAEQFYRTKFGDRFFYSLHGAAHPFSLDQLVYINAFTFADLLCMCSSIAEVPTRAFETIDRVRNPLVLCSSRNKINFKLF